ncbi:MMPL family transporter [Motilibacter deserti]|uniref:MMPL family transporter n=1 Tax=Motilibacter deserti TaxID=2714956 RepID=A0ABX0GYM7_9ACTN|nr:MMPL family transporter [Motilibacter deserti]NHC16107.1 MMPL family transporter [Motilibacter deserti]
MDILTRLAYLVIRRRRTVVTVWVLLAAACAPLALALPDRLGPGGFDVAGSQSYQVQEALGRDFDGGAADPAVVLLRGEDAAAAVPAVTAALEDVEGVLAVRPGLGFGGQEAGPGRAYLSVALAGGQDDQVRAAERVVETVDEAVPAGVTADVGGRAALYVDVNAVSKKDLERAEIVSFPLTLLVLLLAFGSLVAAGLPVLLGVASLVVTLGLLYGLSLVSSLSIYVTNTASVIGIAVGIDYALFVVTRFRQELRHGLGVEDAIARSVATAGRAVAVSGLTVMVALGGLFLVDVAGFRSMAIGSMVVVALAVAAALTLLPAVLAMLGGRVDRFTLFRHRPTTGEGGGWYRWSRLVMRRPALFLAGVVAVLLACAVPLLDIRLGQPSASTLPEGSGPRTVMEQVQQDVGPGAAGPVEVLVPTPAGAGSAAGSAALQAVASRAEQVRGVVSATVAGASRDGTVGRVVVLGNSVTQSAEGQETIRLLRDALVGAHDLPAGVLVGGQGASDLDLTSRVNSRLPWVIGTVLLLSLLLLTATLRSPVLAAKAVVMNLLSVGAAYGLMVAVFQWGWGADLLGFTSEGQIQAWVPLFLFCVLFGLSMDYEVFLLSRMREEHARTGDNEQAVALGLEHTARTITSAALVMVTVFAAFSSSRLLAFKAMGFSLAVAVLLDATLVRIVTVPALMRLMGRANWWTPRWLDRVLPRLEAVAPPPAVITLPDVEAARTTSRT